MAFGSFGDNGKQPMAEINMTPLVDVMLVLLIIFIVTAPLMSQSLKVDLPQVKAQPTDAKPDVIRLALDAGGKLYWNESPVAEDALLARLTEAAGHTPPPEVHLSADKETRYQRVAEVMGAAREAGIQKLGFITLPPIKH
ncbi:MAG: biopolymer transporter ExbD [Rhodocyclaceae bacterium]|nr:MAG: biopolymer transporter ExbD [Rhodocyclaceae bacterium]